jgi:hypothetical protein
MSKYQALIDALKAGPDNWKADQYGNLRNESNESVRLNGVSLPCGRVTADDPAHKNTAYVLAANPATISALLADLEAAEKRLSWLLGKHWVEPEVVFRLNLSDTDDAAEYEREAIAAIDAALSQLKGD